MKHKIDMTAYDEYSENLKDLYERYPDWEDLSDEGMNEFSEEFHRINTCFLEKNKILNKEYFEELKELNRKIEEKCKSCVNHIITKRNISYTEEIKCTIGFTCRRSGHCKGFKPKEA